MKTTRISKLAGIAITAVVLAAGAAPVIAQTSTAKDGVARVIYLHAPNNAVQTVTVWVPETRFQGQAKITTTRNQSPQTVELHAPNAPAQSVTTWTGGTEKNSR